MYFDGLIFDLDGTLWDCSNASAKAFNLGYGKFGIERQVTEEFVKSISGKPSSECDEILLINTPSSMKNQLSKCLDQYEIEMLSEHASESLYPGVGKGLPLLQGRYSLHLVSNCGEEYLQTFHRYSSVGHLFSDSECFGRTRRPKGDNIRALIERQRLSSPCYIGDTAGDEEAAFQAKIPFFHAGYGFGQSNKSLQSFPNFDELVGFFLNLPNIDS